MSEVIFQQNGAQAHTSKRAQEWCSKIYPLSGGKVYGQATPQTCPQLKTYEPSSRKSQLGWPKETTSDSLGKYIARNP